MRDKLRLIASLLVSGVILVAGGWLASAIG